MTMFALALLTTAAPPPPSAPPPDAPGGICSLSDGQEGFDDLPGDCKSLIIGCAVGGLALCLCMCATVAFCVMKKKSGNTNVA